MNNARWNGSASKRGLMRTLPWIGLIGMLGWFAPSYGQASKASPSVASPVNVQADLDALIKAAKAEGELTFYTSSLESMLKRTTEAFGAKYGVKANYLRLPSSQVEQRYAAEAESGNIAADMLIDGGDAIAFADAGMKKGWIESASQAGLPVIKSGEFPARFNTGATAVVGIAVWLIGSNTGKVKGGDVPKDWMDLLNPKWKGQILVSSPAIADAYISFWGLLLDKYGESYFTRLRPNLRPVATGAIASQGLAAGEGSFLVPATSEQIEDNRARGAPVDTVTLDFTTGAERHVVLTNRAKAKRPNAARLFANYVMSQEGNKVFNDNPGGFTVYESSKFPRQYQPPVLGASAARREQITKFLGF